MRTLVNELNVNLGALSGNISNYKKILKTVVTTAGGTVQFNVASDGVYLVISDNAAQSAVYLVSEFSNIGYPSPIKANANSMTVTASGTTVTITAVQAYTRVLVIRLD
ncbi:MAG: hypothetical protein K0R34_2169 [Herbinix sp.]|nr:hypothetical protein [Herbinix sp.]